MVLWHPDGVEAECLSQKRLVQHFAEKLLRVAAFRPVGWGSIREGEVTELHARTLLSRWDGGRAWTQRLAHLQGHLDETPFQRVRELLDQRQTFIVPEGCHIRHTQEPPDAAIDNCPESVSRAGRFRPGLCDRARGRAPRAGVARHLRARAVRAPA